MTCIWLQLTYAFLVTGDMKVSILHRSVMGITLLL